jgi:hypothetical protein
MLWLEVVAINCNAIASSLFYHILTIMAIRAGQGTKSLHSVLIRMWQSWVLSMTVLSIINFNEIQMFSWGLEAAQMAAQAGKAQLAGDEDTGNSTNATEEEGGSMTDAIESSIPFPPWFSDVADTLFGISDINVEFNPPTTTIECLTETYFGAENAKTWKYIIQAIYHMLFPLFVMMWMLLLDLILVFVLFGPLEQRGLLARPSEPAKLKKWLNDRVRPRLEASIEEYDVPVDRKEEVVELFEKIMNGLDMTEDNLRLVASMPKVGLPLLVETIQAEDEYNAKKCLLLMSMPRYELEVRNLMGAKESRQKMGFTEDVTTTADQAQNCDEIMETLLRCSDKLPLDEFANLFKGHQNQIFTTIFGRSGGDADHLRGGMLQVCFTYPMYERAAVNHGFSHSLAKLVWESMQLTLAKIGVAKVARLFNEDNPVNHLIIEVDKVESGAATLLIVANTRHAIEAYLRETLLDHALAEQVWDLVVDCCNGVRPMISVLRKEIARGPEAVVKFIAKMSGTGLGGLLLVTLQKVAIRAHWELVGKGESNLDDEWHKICVFAYETPFDELEVLINQRSPANFIDRYTQDKEVKEQATAGGGFGLEKAAKAAGAAAGAAALGAAGLGLEATGGGLAGAGSGTGTVMIMGAYEAVRAAAQGNKTFQDYPVMGLFRKPLPGAPWRNLKRFWRDSGPLRYIGLYTLWYPTTKRLLLLIHCVAEVQEVDGLVESRSRWMQGSNLECYTGTHLLISLFALIGLCIWSFGLLIFLGRAIMKNRKDMTNPEITRRFAYFIAGYEIDKAYWDIAVKKLDNLLTITITYTSLCVDPKAKLLAYAVLGGVFLVIHVMNQPFDERKNRLCERVESLGLMARFLAFGLFEMLLIFSPPLHFAVIAAVITVMMSFWFIFTIGAHILCEFMADLASKEKSGVKVEEDVFFKMRKRLVENQKRTTMTKIKQCMGKFVACLSTIFVKPILSLAINTAKRLSSLYQELEDDALCLMPAPNFVSRVQPRASLKQGILGSLKHQFTLRFFSQGDDQQREFIVCALGGFLTHLICHLQEERLEIGEGLLGRFVVLSRALKQARVEDAIPQGSSATETAEVVKRHLYSSLSRAVKHTMFDENDDEDIFKKLGDQAESDKRHDKKRHTMDEEKLLEKQLEEKKLRLTGEDLNDMLMLLQRLEPPAIKELLNEALNVIAQVKEEGNKATQELAAKSQPLSIQQIRVNPQKDLSQSESMDMMALADQAVADRKSSWKTKALQIMNVHNFPHQERASQADTAFNPEQLLHNTHSSGQHESGASNWRQGLAHSAHGGSSGMFNGNHGGNGSTNGNSGARPAG